jgi:hypothetical protein
VSGLAQAAVASRERCEEGVIDSCGRMSQLQRVDAESSSSTDQQLRQWSMLTADTTTRQQMPTGNMYRTANRSNTEIQTVEVSIRHIKGNTIVATATFLFECSRCCAMDVLLALYLFKCLHRRARKAVI